jgi:putative photosynthetic complex assembly protein
MSGAMHEEPMKLPRGALLGIGFCVGLALLGAVVGRLQGPRPGPVSSADATRNLRFADMPDGSVGVFDASNGATVAMLPRGSNNFIRAMLRAVVHERRDATPDLSSPFVLTAWKDGRLTLADSADGRTVELEAFGSTNEADFARLLTAPEVPKK